MNRENQEYSFSECFVNLIKNDGQVLQLYGMAHENNFTLLRINLYKDYLEMKTYMCTEAGNNMGCWKGPNLVPLSRNLQYGIIDYFKANGFDSKILTDMRIVTTRKEIETYCRWLYTKATECQRLYDENVTRNHPEVFLPSIFI